MYQWVISCLSQKMQSWVEQAIPIWQLSKQNVARFKNSWIYSFQLFTDTKAQ